MEVLKELLVYVSGLLAVAVVGTLLPLAAKWLKRKGEEAATDARRSLFYLGSGVATTVAGSLRSLAEDFKARTSDKKLTEAEIAELQAEFHKAWKAALADFADRFSEREEITYREAALDDFNHPE